MLKFTSEIDLSQINPTNPAYPVITKLVTQLGTEVCKTNYPYDPEVYGFIALIEPEDDELAGIIGFENRGLMDIPWEAVTHQDGVYIGLYHSNHQYGLLVVVPDANWLNGDLRNAMEKYLINKH